MRNSSDVRRRPPRASSRWGIRTTGPSSDPRAWPSTAASWILAPSIPCRRPGRKSRRSPTRCLLGTAATPAAFEGGLDGAGPAGAPSTWPATGSWIRSARSAPDAVALIAPPPRTTASSPASTSYAMHIPADLVVLSACDTGKGEDNPGGGGSSHPHARVHGERGTPRPSARSGRSTTKPPAL